MRTVTRTNTIVTVTDTRTYATATAYFLNVTRTPKIRKGHCIKKKLTVSQMLRGFKLKKQI